MSGSRVLHTPANLVPFIWPFMSVPTLLTFSQFFFFSPIILHLRFFYVSRLVFSLLTLLVLSLGLQGSKDGKCDEDWFPSNAHTHSVCVLARHWSLHHCLVSLWMGEEVLAVSACDVIKKAEQLRRGGEENVSSSFSIFKPCTIVINSYTELSLWWSIACFAKVLKGSTFSELLRFTNLQKFKATRNVKALSVQQCTRAGDRFCAGMLV